MTIFLRGLFLLVAVVTSLLLAVDPSHAAEGELRWAPHVTLGAGLIAGFGYSAPLEDLKIKT